MAKKSTNDEDFLRQVREERGASSHVGMVMTKPPTSPSKSLAEVLQEAGPIDSFIGDMNNPPRGDETLAALNQPAGAGAPSDAEAGVQMTLSIDAIQRSPFQVRHIDEQAIEELMESIRDTNGLITPIVVRRIGSGRYEAIAGHTRLEACQRLGYATIPAIVRDMDEAAAAKALAADNLTRKDLTDFEIFKQLNVLFAKSFLRSNAEASRLLGRTRQDIIRYQAFGKLPPDVVELLERDPALVGANVAKELAELVAQGHDQLVIDGCRHLFDGMFKTQVSVLAWVRQRTAVRPEKHEFRIVDGKGKPFARVSISSGGAIKISGDDLDLDAIEALLRDGLPKCRKQGQR